jgi:H+/Cl- antiporter ClcA
MMSTPSLPITCQHPHTHTICPQSPPPPPQSLHAIRAAAQAYLNGIDVPGIFLVSTLVAKMLGSIGAVAAGLAVGKEGPFVHAGAAIGALLSQVGAG